MQKGMSIWTNRQRLLQVERQMLFFGSDDGTGESKRIKRVGVITVNAGLYR